MENKEVLVPYIHAKYIILHIEEYKKVHFVMLPCKIASMHPLVSADLRPELILMEKKMIII